MTTRISVVVLLVALAGCTTEPTATTEASSGEAATVVEFQGHRGARGLLPENSIPGFIMALDLGVRTLELDVTITSDDVVVVSHEPWMSATICSHPDGRAVTEEEERSLNIFTLTAEEVASFDCGSRGHAGFPDQQPMSTIKPTLHDLVDSVERHVAEYGYPLPIYNVEVKSSVAGDGVNHPAPDDFALLVHSLLEDLGVLSRTTIQSFDPRALEAMNALDPDVTLGWLVGNENGYDENMARLTFRPDIYTPHHGLVSDSLVAAVHGAGMLLIPWTVNETDRMIELIELGVDAIITDYPDRGQHLLLTLSN